MTLPSLGETGITLLMVAGILGVCGFIAWVAEISDRRAQRRERDADRQAAREAWRREWSVGEVYTTRGHSEDGLDNSRPLR